MLGSLSYHPICGGDSSATITSTVFSRPGAFDMDELLLAHTVPLLEDCVDQFAVLGACRPSQQPDTNAVWLFVLA